MKIHTNRSGTAEVRMLSSLAEMPFDEGFFYTYFKNINLIILEESYNENCFFYTWMP